MNANAIIQTKQSQIMINTILTSKENANEDHKRRRRKEKEAGPTKEEEKAGTEEEETGMRIERRSRKTTQQRKMTHTDESLFLYKQKVNNILALSP